MIPYEIQLIRSPEGEYLPEIIRLKKPEPKTKQIKITDLKHVIPIIKIIKDHSQEQAIVISLDAEHNVLATRVVHIGNSRECSINTADIFRGPLIDGATWIIFAHNHPTGDLKPSKEDKKTTKLLFKAGEYLGLGVLDCVIIGPSGIYSMNEKRKVSIKGGSDMKKEIRYCPDRRCDTSGMYDPKTPLCLNEESGGTTYCSTQCEIFGCPRGFEP